MKLSKLEHKLAKPHCTLTLFHELANVNGFKTIDCGLKYYFTLTKGLHSSVILGFVVQYQFVACKMNYKTRRRILNKLLKIGRASCRERV